MRQYTNQHPWQAQDSDVPSLPLKALKESSTGTDEFTETWLEQTAAVENFSVFSPVPSNIDSDAAGERSSPSLPSSPCPRPKANVDDPPNEEQVGRIKRRRSRASSSSRGDKDSKLSRPNEEEDDS
jgi:hypothetical protein